MGSGQIVIKIGDDDKPTVTEGVQKEKVNVRDEFRAQVLTDTVITDFERREILLGIDNGGELVELQSRFEQAQLVANPEFRQEDKATRMRSLLGTAPIKLLRG